MGVVGLMMECTSALTELTNVWLVEQLGTAGQRG